MDNIGKITKWTVNLLGRDISFNPEMFLMTWIVMAVILLIAIITSRKLTKVPSKLQTAVELFYLSFKDLVVATLGEEMAQKYVNYIATLFIFLILSNYLGILPPVFNFFYLILARLDTGLAISGLSLFNLVVPWSVLYILGFMVIIYVMNLLITKKLGKLTGGYKAGLSFAMVYFIVANWPWIIPIPDKAYTWMSLVPEFQEPTKFLSTPLGLGILSFFIVHISAIKVKGIMGYIGAYMDPLPGEGWWLLLFPINPFFYLNVVGEIAKVISHSFRLFGNILGGSIIILIISNLIHFMALPVFLNGFFGLFSGAIQAFVFTMLAITYIAVQVK